MKVGILNCWGAVQGCSLRNTDAIVGAVVFSGHETKVCYSFSISFSGMKCLN